VRGIIARIAFLLLGLVISILVAVGMVICVSPSLGLLIVLTVAVVVMVARR
jgi:hypothetical protein